MFTRWGFTTVFDVASVLSNTNYIRSQIETGKLPGPRILTVGEPFWVQTPIYVQQFLATFNISMPEVHSIPEARARVDQQIHDGADGIKIFAGSIEADHVELMPQDLAALSSPKPTATTSSSSHTPPPLRASSSRSTLASTSSLTSPCRKLTSPEPFGRPHSSPA